MANLPSSNHNITHHLTDRAGTPLISSSASSSTFPSQPTSQARSLSSLTTTAMIAYDTASRLGLGLPQRILIETSSSGPVILHSYLRPQPSQLPRTPASGRGIVEQAREDLRPLSGTTENSSVAGGAGGEALLNGAGYGKAVQETGEEGEEEGNARQIPPPMLVGTVVAATAAEAVEARRTAARLERMGREFQREWTRSLGAASGPASATGSGDDG